MKRCLRIFCTFVYIAAHGAPGHFTYIGLMDITGDNADYRWIRDGTKLNFTNWGPDEPHTTVEECVAVFNHEPNIGKWLDITCSLEHSAMCESDRVSQTNFLKQVTPNLKIHEIWDSIIFDITKKLISWY